MGSEVDSDVPGECRLRVWEQGSRRILLLTRDPQSFGAFGNGSDSALYTQVVEELDLGDRIVIYFAHEAGERSGHELFSAEFDHRDIAIGPGTVRALWSQPNEVSFDSFEHLVGFRLKWSLDQF